MQDFGGKERKSMNRKVIYTDAPPEIEYELEHSVRIADDFLPSPEFFRLMNQRPEQNTVRNGRFDRVLVR